MFHGPGVHVVPFEPSAGPVPPPINVVTPLDSACGICSGVRKWTCVSIAPGVATRPSPEITSVPAPIVSRGSTPSCTYGFPAWPMPTIRPVLDPDIGLHDPQHRIHDDDGGDHEVEHAIGIAHARDLAHAVAERTCLLRRSPPRPGATDSARPRRSARCRPGGTGRRLSGHRGRRIAGATRCSCARSFRLRSAREAALVRLAAKASRCAPTVRGGRAVEQAVEADHAADARRIPPARRRAHRRPRSGSTVPTGRRGAFRAWRDGRTASTRLTSKK